MEPDGQVVIRKKIGTVFTLAPTVFSAEDQKFIRDWDLTERGLPLELDERITPGNTFRLELPDLPRTKQGQPAGAEIHIPKSFSYPAPVPLAAWIAGGGGGDKVAPAKELVDFDRYVVIALPFPDGSEPAKDWWEKPEGAAACSAYHEAILDEIHRLIPNIDPRLRAVMGYSNGAHTLNHAMAEEWLGYKKSFNVFVTIEGGGDDRQGYDFARGKHYYYAYGDKSPVLDYQVRVLAKLEESRPELLVSKMVDTGHQFPATEKTKVGKWFTEVVEPSLLVDVAEKQARSDC